MSERPYRILIIEDNPLDRAVFRRRISQGHEQKYLFWEAESGTEGLRLFQEVEPDCILLDYQLPDVDGLEFLDLLQAAKSKNDLTVIMLTAHGNEAVAVEAMKKGAEDYLVKGLNSDNLRQAVQAAIDKGIMRRELDERRRELLKLSAERLQLIEELREQATALAAMNQHKDEFLATLAHELRNPLAPIRNSLQIMQLAGNDKAAFERARPMMERQISHMVRLIDDLLDVSRFSRGLIELRKEPVTVERVVNDAIEISNSTVQGGRHALTVTLPDTPIHLHADPTRITQVIANLLNNAAKYTEPGGRIWLTVECHGSEAIIEVRDTGVGIPHDKQPNVFELFFQVNRTSDRSQGGLGIGLTLVKSLVEMHGGTVSVRSEGQGKGCVFTVRIPIVTVSKLATEPSKVTKFLNQEGQCELRRILVIDDNVDAANSLVLLLETLGHDARAAYSGAAGLAEIESYAPEIILLDLGMPAMSGYEVAKSLRSRFNGQTFRLIALSGWGTADDRQRTLEAGFNHHLVKPVALAELQDCLGRVVSGT